VGIRGNENADIAAKAGLDVAITNMRFPVGDLSACVNQLCVKEWQQLWSQCTSNKLYSVQPVIGRNTSSSLSRYDSFLINFDFDFEYKTYKLLSPRGRKSTGM